MGITIKKAKIIKSENLEVTYTEELGGEMNSVKKECSAKIHEDLRQAFQALNPHLSDLCEQYDEEGNSCLSFISCNGFSIGGTGESEGVTLIGQRVLDSGKVLNLTSPFEKWQDEAGEYGAIDELSLAIEACKSEVYSYLFESKHAPDAQLSLSFTDGGNGEGGAEEA